RILCRGQIGGADVDGRVDAVLVAGGAGALLAVCHTELTRGKEIDAAQNRFAKGALTDGEIGRGEITPPRIEQCRYVIADWNSTGTSDTACEVIGAKQSRSSRFGEDASEDVRLLGREELAFEILNLLELRASGSGRCLLMRQSSGSSLRLERALAAVSHEGV